MRNDIVIPPSPIGFAGNISHTTPERPSTDSFSACPLPPTSDPLDLMNRIVGLYRLLDLISEEGSGGAGAPFLSVLSYIPKH